MTTTSSIPAALYITPAATLPLAIVDRPDCGACHGQTMWSAGLWVCPECRLTYDEHGTSPRYINPTHAACSAPCTNHWHTLRADRGEACHPCTLPEGHTSAHWSPCRTSEG